MGRDISELYRLLENLLDVGVIVAVDEQSRRFKARINERETSWRPFPTDFGRNFRRWRSLRVGAQALFACPSGDPANAHLVQMLYSRSFPPPSTSPDIDVIEFNDGCSVSYDSGASRLAVDVPENGSIILTVGATSLELRNDGTTLATPDFEGVQT